jgi:hypothetical protein
MNTKQDKRFEAVRQLYNACLGETKRCLDNQRQKKGKFTKPICKSGVRRSLPPHRAEADTSLQKKGKFTKPICESGVAILPP